MPRGKGGEVVVVASRATAHRGAGGRVDRGDERLIGYVVLGETIQKQRGKEIM